MSAVRVRVLLLALTSMLLVGRSPPTTSDVEPIASAPKPPSAAALAKMPARFEANAGQHDGSIRFVARRGAAALVLRDEGATFMIQQRTAPKKRGEPEQRANRVVIGLKVDGGRSVAPRASEEQITKTNYFVGADESKWRTNVPSYAKVTYPSVLDGVDLVYHGENGALEYDFVVAPGTTVESVAMNVEGAAKMSLTETGDLRIHTYAGDIVQPAPVVYQRDLHGVKHTVPSSYRLVGPGKVGFKVSSYDQTKPLVIDPLLGFATYLGGSGYDGITGITADASGNTYVTGYTYSTDFPTANAYDPTFNVYDLCQECVGQTDVFVAKLDPTGANLLYATYLGGYGQDDATGIAVDASGDAYVTGSTSSYNFPLVSSINSRGFDQVDGFVSRIGQGGNTLVYSTYLTGSNEDLPKAIAVDGTGIYIAGSTASGDFTEPQVRNVEITPHGGASGGSDYDAFVLKLAPAGNTISFLKYLGGHSNDEANALAVDATGNAFITGSTYSTDFPQGANPLKANCASNESTDAFVAKLGATGTTFEYATCLGGNNEDYANGIAVDGSGNAYVTGQTYSTDFPAPSSIYPFGGASDVFVSKLNPAGSALVYSTFIGGENSDVGRAIAVDSSNTAWVTGGTPSEDFPMVAALQATYAGGGGKDGRDAFVARVNSAGSALIFSSFYGGATGFDEGVAIAVNGTSVHLGGDSYSTDLPLQNARQQTNAGQQDGFVAQISTPKLLISPPTVLVPVGSGQQFAAAGGAGFGYVFSMQANPSGGSITPTGAYSAGVIGSVVDVVLVTDAAGLTATATVQLGPNTPTLVISPTNTSVVPKGIRAFAASGGAPPYAFSFGSNASGASISPTGSYTAGIKGGVTDVVRVTDSLGTNVSATVTVGPSITITPATPAAPPNGSVSFAATGGSGSGYLWSFAKNNSGGAIVAATGKYTAGSGSKTVDTVLVTDSLGNKGSVNVSVGGGLAVSPADPTTTTRGTIVFSAVGGSGAYTWALTSAPSGGTIDAGSGVYVAGTTGNAIDVVRIQDSVGNSSTVQITVGPSLVLDPPVASVLTGGKVAFGAAGGSGVGYTYALTTNQSGGSVGSDGIYTAGTNAGTDVVRLTDSLGSTDDATITVTTSPILPDGGVNPAFDAGVVPGLNIGGGGAGEDCTCHAVGGGPSAPGAARMLAAFGLLLGFVVRRRRRR